MDVVCVEPEWTWSVFARNRVRGARATQFWRRLVPTFKGVKSAGVMLGWDEVRC